MNVCRNTVCLVASAICTFVVMGYTSSSQAAVPLVSHAATAASATL